MVCQCKPPLDGSMGCGDECLNRMLNIECVSGTCPCGNLCSNQQFQKRKYAKFKWFRCGKKGFGLQLLEDVSEGEFLIEYVGEVLDLAAYEERQREYAFRGQKHFYFMTLNGNEVIDACAKGNLGRFINHSCEPNCCTEKWMVNGEVCIGLFAMRDIKKGEEVTFDYNYVRVFGAAANRCLCGSAECRGYIGGDPLSNKVFIQGDSDDKYPELAMICEDSEPEQHMDVVIPELTNATTVQHSVKNCKTAGKTSTVGQGMDIHLQSDDAFLKSSSDVRLSEISSPSKSEIGSYSNAKRIHKAVDDNQHASILHHRVKLSSSRSSFKKGSCITNKSVVQRGIKPSTGSNTQPAVLRPGQLEGVEERLNELLDDGGGISKRRDATKGYLKLLFLTATSGDTVKCEASQSTRDLSLILDAILKTTSNRVLVDIINKNGLQMLHNIMKQNGKSFNRIPILRKLLKVLEFLAVKGILTPEHINTIPSHAGVESFKDSIIKLTYHKDMQVHQIARTFRDKWLPRTIRKVNLSDRDNGWVNLKRGNPNRSPPFRRHHNQGLRDSEAICVSQVDHAPSSLHGLDAPSQTRSIHSKQVSTSAASVSINSTPVKLQKRKSRWDQPCDATNLDLQIHPEEHGAQTRPKMMKSFLDKPESNFYTKSEKELISLSAKITGSTDLMLHGIEELPPGFGSPISNGQLWNPDISTVSAEVAVGHAQARYLPQLTVSYGFPLTLVRQLSTAGAEVEGDQNQPSGIIAAGMPFHPFPPLPPLGKMDYSHHKMMLEGGREEIRPTDSAASEFESSIPSSAVERSPEVAESKIGSQLAEKMSQASNGLKRRFSQPARWNKCKYQKFGPPWPRERNGYMRNWISNEAL
uniref:Histone-lysine N-methyltransferase ASHH2 n=1 Tax=Anthurium amnicola TaxID=1678845 RepID=A0A1D1YLR0_9ARAE